MTTGASSLVLRAERTLNHIYSELKAAAKRAGAEISGHQAMILALMTEDMTVSEIMNAVYAGTNVSYNLKVLHALRLIERNPATRDKRSIVVKRTRRGREIGEVLSAAFEGLMTDIAKGELRLGARA